jgi:2-polyprenyl-3-methyl-5-hydroxy-6-metoxy-1,4-benzoquinol methylase
MKDTKDISYSRRLVKKENAAWKRLLNVQLPYRFNLRRLKLGHVLDIGCGIGRNLNNLDGNGVGVDHNEHSVALVRERGFEAYTTQEFNQQIVANQQFDSLLIAHVIEHTGQKSGIQIINEYLPYLRPQGKVVLITPQEKGFNSDPTHIEFIDFTKQKEIIENAGLAFTRAYSFPFPRFVGRLFPYNEFITIGIKK